MALRVLSISAAPAHAIQTNASIITIELDASASREAIEAAFRALNADAVNHLTYANGVILALDTATQAEYLFEQLIDELPLVRQSRLRAFMRLSIPGSVERTFENNVCATARATRHHGLLEAASYPMAA